MKKSFYSCIVLFNCLLVFSSRLQAQSVGINTLDPNASAALDISSTSKGILIPRLLTSERIAISLPAEGLQVFDRDTKTFWYYKLSAWHELKGGAFENNSGTVRNAGNTATDDFVFGATVLPPSTNITSNLFFFDKSKAAFRTGNVTNGNHWAATKLGQNSFATGQNTLAEGVNSAAFGAGTDATGVGSTAFGKETHAKGSYSLAIGNYTIADAPYSLATGDVTNAFGDFSATFGYETTTTGDYSIAAGNETSSAGLYAFATGQNTQANGVGTFAHGFHTKADAYASVAIGRYNTGGGNTTSWISSDPIFEIGIGTGASSRGNGLTMLKNGDFVLGSSSPPGSTMVSDTLMFYDHSKGAFRGGFLLNSTAWAPDSIGVFSFGSGFNTVAKSPYSVAFGNQTRATNTSATAFGSYSHASGLSSLASGHNALAVGWFSGAIGQNTNAASLASLAIGRFNVGIGNPSVFVSTDPALEIGNGLSTSLRSNAFTIFKNGAFIAGSHELPTIAEVTDKLMLFNRENGSFRVGEVFESTNWAPHSTGFNSFAAGYNTLASDTTAVSLGFSTTASNFASMATGFETIASGKHSFSAGVGTKADAYSSAAFGNHNVGGGDPNFPEPLDPLFEVGNGFHDIFRRNAMTILYNGNIGIGDHNPTAFLDINTFGDWNRPHLKITSSIENIPSILRFSNAIETDNWWDVQVRSDNIDHVSNFNIAYSDVGSIFRITGEGFVGINGTPTTDLHIRHKNNGLESGMVLQNSFGGDYFRMYISSGSGDLRFYSKVQANAIIGNFDDVTGEYTYLSDRRVKSNFENLHFDWTGFMQLKPLTYTYIADQSNTKSLGMVAQDVQAIYPELVTFHEDVDLYHLNYAGFGVVAIKAVQEMYQENLVYRDKVTSLEDSNAALQNELILIKDSNTVLRNELDQIKERLGMK